MRARDEGAEAIVTESVADVSREYTASMRGDGQPLDRSEHSLDRSHS